MFTRPSASQEVANRPSPVAANESRARNAITAARNSSGNTNAASSNPTVCRSLGCSQPLAMPPSRSIPMPKAKKPRASDVPYGRTTIRTSAVMRKGLPAAAAEETVAGGLLDRDLVVVLGALLPRIDGCSRRDDGERLGLCHLVGLVGLDGLDRRDHDAVVRQAPRLGRNGRRGLDVGRRLEHLATDEAAHRGDELGTCG